MGNMPMNITILKEKDLMTIYPIIELPHHHRIDNSKIVCLPPTLITPNQNNGAGGFRRKTYDPLE
jgi:hypothetical protein